MSINASINLVSPAGVLSRQASFVARHSAYANRHMPAVQIVEPPPFLSTLWRHRDIWFTPLACEIVLFFCALHLSSILARVMQNGTISWQDWLPVAAGAAAYTLGKIECEKEELFMTRFVAVSGSGGIMLMALLVMGLITVIAPGLVGVTGLTNRMVLMLPLGILLLREAMLIRGSRFAPSMASLSLRHNRPVGVTTRLRQYVHYWMH